MNTKEKDNIIFISIVITALLFLAILGWILLYSPDAFNHVKEMRLNDWGGFFRWYFWDSSFILAYFGLYAPKTRI